jgi:hypothetical protein
VISLRKCNRNASNRNHLQKEDSGHGGKTKSAVDSAEGSGRAGLLAAAILVGGLVALLTGVLDLATAEVLAANDLLVLEPLVEVARLADVAGRLEVEGTLDEVELLGLDTVVC